ncbi:MAG: hypothetical protein E7277_09565 [Lachnospiraceae bacterium]|nr:hypothetical protein [Lachnospiraceae bacterium]
MQQKMKKLLAGFLALVMVLTVVNIPAKSVQAAEGDVSITLLETTDVHGHLVEESDNGADVTKNQYKMAYLSKVFNDYRAQGETILLDSGDIYQGTVMSNLSYGKYMMQTYAAMKYDAVAVGNHEFDWGIEKTVSNGKIPGTEIPVVACNIYDKKTKAAVSFAKPYTILEKGGKKIAVIGWVAEYSADIMKERFKDLYEVKEDATLVNNTAKLLKDNKLADAVIVLAHADVEDCVELFDAKAVDFVFGGHSHMEKVGVGKNGIPYAEAYKEARGYCHATMTITKDNKVSVTVPKFVSIIGDNEKNLTYTDANKDKLDEAIVKISNDSIKDAQGVLSKQLGVLKTPLKRELIAGSLTSTMGNWVTDMLRLNSECDIAFCNDGGIRCDFEPKTITMGDIYKVSPFSNKLNKVVMTGAQVVNVLEQIVGNDSSNMQMSGITAKYDLSQPEDKQVFDVQVGGQPIDLTKEYTVWVNEYIAKGGNKYVAFDDEHKDYVSNTATDIVDNQWLLKNVTSQGVLGEFKVDTNPRFTEGKMEQPKPEEPSEEPVVVKKSLKFAKKTTTLKVGKSYTFKVKVQGLDGKVKWTSSNKKVAIVKKNGTYTAKVTAKKVGKTTIKATVGGKSVKITLKVKKK